MDKLLPMFLNIGAGKIEPILEFPRRYCLINLDPMFMGALSAEEAETHAHDWKYKQGYQNYINTKIYSHSEANPFLERTVLKFDKIFMYRYLEHVPFDQVLYFIYLLSTVTKPGAEIDVIVPDYKILANILLLENINSKDFEKNNILLTTELLNEPSCPHASIWTVDRALYFWSLEDRFRIREITTPYSFDGRHIYLRFIAERI